MDLTQISGYLLAILVGISLGLMGSGGSILTVPILVYVMGISPILATAYSLFIVGMTALTGSINNAVKGKIDFRKVIIFGIPSVVSVFITRIYLVPRLPEIILIGDFKITKPVFVMTLFAIVMMAASFAMLRSPKEKVFAVRQQKANSNILICIIGAAIGIIAGLVGSGGGFLIVPSLAILMKTPIKKAIATSLAIVSIQSLIGFSGDLLSNQEIDWKLLLVFTAFSIGGIFIGILLSRKIPGQQLKKGFGWFILLMGIYIIAKELLNILH